MFLVKSGTESATTTRRSSSVWACSSDIWLPHEQNKYSITTHDEVLVGHLESGLCEPNTSLTWLTLTGCSSRGGWCLGTGRWRRWWRVELCPGTSSDSDARGRTTVASCPTLSDGTDCPSAVSAPSSIPAPRHKSSHDYLMKKSSTSENLKAPQGASVLTSSFNCLIQNSIMGFRAPLADQSILKAAL